MDHRRGTCGSSRRGGPQESATRKSVGPGRRGGGHGRSDGWRPAHEYARSIRKIRNNRPQAVHLRTKTCPRWAFRSRRLWAALRSQNWAVIRKNRPRSSWRRILRILRIDGGRAFDGQDRASRPGKQARNGPPTADGVFLRILRMDPADRPKGHADTVRPPVEAGAPELRGASPSDRPCDPRTSAQTQPSVSRTEAPCSPRSFQISSSVPL